MRLTKLRGLLFLVLAFTVICSAFFFLRSSLPKTRGIVQLKGPKADISIERDKNGIPYISATSESDALFALGFVHAQDRLWQLDFNRRIASGRVSEIAGSQTVETDQFLRILGLNFVAKKIAANFDPETRELLKAYVDGINSHMASASGALPPEFLLASAPPPAPWTIEDSIAWSLLMAWDLSSQSYRNELARYRLSAKLSLAEINEFKPAYPGDLPLATGDYVALYKTLGLRANESSGQKFALLGLDPSSMNTAGAIGSNNWALAAAWTASAQPLLANDPHLGLAAPSLWYVAHLKAPGIDVFGATLPGLPYALIGRNRQVAWGFTNTAPDVQDLYLERIDPADNSHYLAPDGSRAFEIRKEQIQVRGSDLPIDLIVRSTRHGPVISDATRANQKPTVGAVASTSVVLSLRWTAFEAIDNSFRALRAMNRAKDANAFEFALHDWTLATQNVLFADTNGQIGFIAAGRIPVRRSDNGILGVAPSPGWDARYDWQGWIAFDQLPRSRQPASGLLVTANHKIVDATYTHYLTNDWTPPTRAQRIESLLRETNQHTVKSMQAIQADFHASPAREVLNLLRDIEPGSAAGKLALERLQAWDGSMQAELPEPLILHAWLRELRARIFSDDLGSLADDYVAPSELTSTLINVLSGKTQARDWCDDQSTPRHETCKELAAEALDDAVSTLVRTSGLDPNGLQWQQRHIAIFEHRPFSAVAFLKKWFERRVPVGGDSQTVNVSALFLRGDEPFSTKHAASFRVVFDLAPDQTGAFIVAPGQSGHPLSHHYDDLLLPWRNNALLPIQWSPPNDADRLILRPN